MGTRLLFILLVSVCSFMARGARAVTSGPPQDKTLSPYLYVENADPKVDGLPLQNTRVDVAISGSIANVTVTQTYKNEGQRPLHAKYVFPASTRAAVHGLRMQIGNEVVVAKIKERAEARRDFEASKKTGKSATLLEQERPNVFTMNLSHVMPGDRIELTLNYTELLVPTHATYEFVYPTVVGPRYSNRPRAKATPGDQWVQSGYLEADAPKGHTFQLSGSLSTGVAVRSLVSISHPIDEQRSAANVVHFELDSKQPQANDRDFILRYRLAGDAIDSGLMLHEAFGEKFFALVVEPPARVLPHELPPREYVFVVDVSGSMHGFPLDTAKRLLRELALNLRPFDRFNVVLFSGASQLLAPRSLPATAENIAQALQIIDRQQGGGGTELLPALEQALSLTSDHKLARSFVVITDGYIEADRNAMQYVRTHLGQANVFAFGIGSSVNRYLIEGLAEAGLGEPFVVTEPSQAAAAAARLKEYVLAPVLTNIRVAYAGFQAYDVQPAAIPDVFAERPVVIHGKWRGTAQGSITLSGVSGTGTYSRRFELANEPSRPEASALPYLWARSRISALSDFGAGSEPTAQERSRVTALGLKYNLLTRFTSFVAVSEAIRNPSLSGTDVAQPLALPIGVSEFAVGDSMHGAPEPELWLLTALAALLLLCGLVLRRSRPSGAAC